MNVKMNVKMNVAAVLTVSVLFVPLLLADTSPGDSTCRAIWLFNLPCAKPYRALARQVRAWSSNRCEDEQEKCLYKIIRSSPSYLEVMHTSRDLQKATVMYFDFYPPEAPHFCKIWAYSVTAPVNATNPNDYCLFHNLFEGSGLTNAPGFKEISNERMCPSITSATCFPPESQLSFV